ncbi:MAG TPA: porin [Bacteriovoracaceae bacterium]|nr:porin [Bacteriovoracaceae bacterium]
MKLILLLLIIISTSATAQNEPTSLIHVQNTINETLLSKWYEKLQVRGYSQVRYNRLGESNRRLKCSSCDKSIGDKQNFFLRRARLTFFGDISDRIFVYIQPDYATEAGNQNYLQIRDAYFDYNITKDKELRIRTGVSKVPYGFVNLQSSSNRGPLDRDEALNSAVSNERDTGVFLMYTPLEVRQRFKEMTSNNLKGSGDYGMIAIGAYNGQTLNRAEKNNDLHRVIRLTYPFKLATGQFIETSLQAYEGIYNTNGTTMKNVYDQRSAASFIVYPQPFGFQAEYNVGSGPEFDPARNEIRNRNLKGGYAQVNYQIIFKDDRIFPFVRYQQYQGGRKLDDGAPRYEIEEWEIGTEWQPNSAFELTAAYNISDRLTQSSLTNRSDEKGSMIRLQAQFNY